MIPVAIGRLARRMRYLVRRTAMDREMADEMRLHLALEIEERVRGGMSPGEARRTALVDFGGVERFKDEGRAARGTQPLHDLSQDVRYAARVLRKSAAFTLTSVLTIAIGVAATTTAFGAVEAILLRPPPVLAPDRLVAVSEIWKGGMRSYETNMAQYMYQYAHYRDLRAASRGILDGLAGYNYGTASVRLGSGAEARVASTIGVSTNYFQVLGVHPAIGRMFADTSVQVRTADPEVVISYDFWQQELGGDSSVIGRSLVVNSRPRTIIGVAPPGFSGTMIGLLTDLWLPTTGGSVAMIGRLAPGVSSARAAAALSAVDQHLPVDAAWQQVTRVVLDPMTGPPEMARGPVTGFMGMLFVTAVLVLLIIAANIAGVFLARSAHRRREIAMRLALGAGRGRIMRQLLTESVLLCLVGGMVGVFLTTWLVRLIPALNLPMGPRARIDLRIDLPVLLVSLGVALVAGVAAGIVPALQSARVDLLSGLRGIENGGPRGFGRPRASFLVAQLSMSLVLLLTAGLFIRALQRGTHVDRGLDATQVVVAHVDLGPHGYDDVRGRAFYSQLMARLAVRPELESVALGQWTPLSTSHMGEGITAADGHRVAVTWGIADEHYLATLHIPVLAGRSFDATDTRSSAPVVVVNHTLAERMWPGRSALGQQLSLRGVRTVVGVVRDGKYRGLDESPTAYAFLPVSQQYTPGLTIHARVRGDLGAGLAAVRAEVAALDANIALESAGPLADQIEIFLLPQRFAAWCVGLFGLVGLGLAAIGTYGAIAYHVARRTRELGIRLALGARGRDMVLTVLRPALRLVLLSIAIGLPVAAAVAVLIRDFLYGVAGDAITFGVVPLVLGGVAVLASWLPARRAARLDPMVSLRAE